MKATGGRGKRPGSSTLSITTGSISTSTSTSTNSIIVNNATMTRVGSIPKGYSSTSSLKSRESSSSLLASSPGHPSSPNLLPLSHPLLPISSPNHSPVSHLNPLNPLNPLLPLSGSPSPVSSPNPYSSSPSASNLTHPVFPSALT